MKRLSLSVALITICTSFMPQVSANDISTTKLPEALESTLQKAHSIGDKYVLEAVVTAMKVDNTAFAEGIDVFVVSLGQQSDKKNLVDELAVDLSNQLSDDLTGLNEITPAAGKVRKNWDASIEMGANIETGNTQKEQVNINAQLNNKIDKWENIAKILVDFGAESGKNTNEEYRFNNQLRYNISDINYSFGEFEYVNDRFSGYEYRISELVGYGHYFIKEDKLKLSGEVGVGARQSALNGGDNENSFLGSVNGKLDWQLADNIRLTEDLTISAASDAVITKSETAIKSNLADNLYLKVGFNVEHISDVPPNTENIDTVTKVTVGYDF